MNPEFWNNMTIAASLLTALGMALTAFGTVLRELREWLRGK